MTDDMSQSWLAQAGRGASRDGLLVAGLMAITSGALAFALKNVTGASAFAALDFLTRALTAIGGFLLALPLFLGATGDDRWSSGVRITGLIVGFLIILFTLIRL